MEVHVAYATSINRKIGKHERGTESTKILQDVSRFKEKVSTSSWINMKHLHGTLTKASCAVDAPNCFRHRCDFISISQALV